MAKSGSIHAQRSGEEPRSLSCNDVIHACDTVITSGGARVGLLTGDLYAHVEGGSRLEVGTAGSEGSLPSLTLHSGAVRVIDPRAEGSEGIPLSTPHLKTMARATDTELWVGDADTRVCNHGAGLDLAGMQGGDPLSVQSGCAVSGGDGVVASGAEEPSIDVQNAPSCGIEAARFFSPSDVALPGIEGFPSVAAADVFRRDACEASGCGVTVTPIPPVTPPGPPRPDIIVDPNPDAGCGGPGFGC